MSLRLAISGPFRLAVRAPLATSAHVPARAAAVGAARQLSTTPACASGHSRWSKIRHKKGAADQQRGAYFSRLMNDVHIALRPPANHDPDANPRLAAALQKARDAGVPKANIESAFARARKLADGTGKVVLFEGIGPGGKVGLMIECITENQARTVSRVKELLHKRDGRMSPVAFLFERKGIVRVQPAQGSTTTFDDYFEAAIEGGAEDVREVETDEGIVWEASTAPTDLGKLTALLSAPPHDAAYTVQVSEVAYVPNDPLPVLAEGEEGEGISEDRAETIERLVDALEEEPDVVKVWTNLAE